MLHGHQNIKIPICMFHLVEFFCWVFKFCACFSKNLTKCLHTNMTQDGFHDWFSVETLCRQ